jgi:hypothetical protein
MLGFAKMQTAIFSLADQHKKRSTTTKAITGFNHAPLWPHSNPLALAF